MSIARRAFPVLLALALLGGACAQDGADTAGESPAAKEGPTITVGSFNFPESVILGQIYLQALGADGYTVEAKLDLGSRELIFPRLEEGEIDFLPEYVGNALIVGFEQDSPSTAEEAGDALGQAFAERDIEVLEAAPGEDADVFVVTGEYAQENGLENISDLADVEGSVRLGGPPECETRDSCLLGLQSVYELDNIEFQAIPEPSGRVSALEQGSVDAVLMFSTQPVIEQNEWVSLVDDRDMIAPQNIVPVVRSEIVEAYGDEFTDLVNSVSERITTDVLLELNGQVELEARDPDEVAAEWLRAEGFIE